MLRVKSLCACDLFVGIWALYYLQGIVYPSGLINQILQLVMILIGIYTTVRCVFQRELPGVLKTALCLILMYTVYGMLIIIFDDGISVVSNTYYLKISYNSLLPIFFFYYYSKRNILTETKIRIYGIICMVVSIVAFIFFGKAIAENMASDEVTNNMGYLFVSLIPMIYFYYTKPLIQYLLMLICIFFIVLGMKRGAILVGFISVVIFLYSGITDGSRRRRLVSTLMTIILLIISAVYVEYMIDNSEYFVHRIEQTKEGNTSNRTEIYSEIWNASLAENSFSKIVLGHGANATIRDCGDFAHQDWLETLYNNGLIGCFLLACFYIAFIVTVFKSKKILPSHYYYSFLTLFVISFSKTLYSMSIQDMSMFQSMLIGYFIYKTSFKR